MGNYVEEAVRVIDNLPTWLVGPEGGRKGGRHYGWSREEEAVLKALYSRVPRAELAERVVEVLRRRTGDQGATRTTQACACRAEELGLTAYQGETDEMSLRWAAELAGLPYHYVHQAARDGRLPTRKAGKQRYVSAGNWESWLARYRGREDAQRQALAAIQEETISKRAAMELIGLGETHFLRYLETGVIRAWKIPDRGEWKAMGFWLVSLASTREFIEARRSGRLSEILDGNPVYVAMRARMTAEVKELRCASRLGRRDPLTTPQSHYNPGCFTVAQVASHVGLSAQVVYDTIARGKLQAVSVMAGGRLRYAVEPEEARRYAHWVAEREPAAKRWHNRRRRDIAAAGLLTVRDLAERWGMADWKAEMAARKVPHRKWGRYLVFEIAEVERFEAAVSPSQGMQSLSPQPPLWAALPSPAGRGSGGQVA